MTKRLFIILIVFITIACNKDDNDSVQELCEVTLDLVATDITQLGYFEATLNGEISIGICDGFSITSQGFVYGINPNPTIEDTIIELSGVSLSTTTENLELNTRYFYRIFLITVDTTYYGNVISFQTPNPELTYVPDDIFEQKLIDLGYDNVLDDYVITDNINEVTELEIQSGHGIADLTGIEDFIALEELVVWNGELTSLDLSNNTLLKILDCKGNHLTSLNVTQNTDLEILYFWGNEITSIDLTNNTKLKKLSCFTNFLTSLDLSHNVELIEVKCWDNNLTGLDVSNNTLLSILNCSYNAMTELILPQQTSLTSLNCQQNQLTFLDLNQSPLLIELYCFSNQLESFDVTEAIALRLLRARSNNLTTIDVSLNLDLIDLSCSQNQLSEINVLSNTRLQNLAITNNNISTLDTSSNLLLNSLTCSNNAITSLDVSHLPSLVYLSCGSTEISQLNIANNNNNGLSILDARDSPNLLCIQIDEGFTPYFCDPFPGATRSWCKDPSTTYAEICN